MTDTVRSAEQQVREALEAAVALDSEWWNGEHSGALGALDALLAALDASEQRAERIDARLLEAYEREGISESFAYAAGCVDDAEADLAAARRALEAADEFAKDFLHWLEHEAPAEEWDGGSLGYDMGGFASMATEVREHVAALASLPVEPPPPEGPQP